MCVYMFNYQGNNLDQSLVTFSKRPYTISLVGFRLFSPEVQLNLTLSDSLKLLKKRGIVQLLTDILIVVGRVRRVEEVTLMVN